MTQCLSDIASTSASDTLPAYERGAAAVTMITVAAINIV
jgi:hypothetical protein